MSCSRLVNCTAAFTSATSCDGVKPSLFAAAWSAYMPRVVNSNVWLQHVHYAGMQQQVTSTQDQWLAGACVNEGGFLPLADQVRHVQPASQFEQVCWSHVMILKIRMESQRTSIHIQEHIACIANNICLHAFAYIECACNDPHICSTYKVSNVPSVVT